MPKNRKRLSPDDALAGMTPYERFRERAGITV